MDLSVEVLPLTVEDRDIAWGSSDENVVVVDETGHVTAVGEGTAVLTAMSVMDVDKYAEVPVKVTCVDNDLNAIVWDEDGEVYFSTFNTNDLPTWTRLHDERLPQDVRTGRTDRQGVRIDRAGRQDVRIGRAGRQGVRTGPPVQRDAVPLQAVHCHRGGL